MSNQSKNRKVKMSLAQFLAPPKVVAGPADPSGLSVRQKMGLIRENTKPRPPLQHPTRQRPEMKVRVQELRRPEEVDLSQFPYLTGVPPPQPLVMGDWVRGIEPLLLNKNKFPPPAAVRTSYGVKRSGKRRRNEGKDIDLLSILRGPTRRQQSQYYDDNEFPEEYYSEYDNDDLFDLPTQPSVPQEVNAWNFL